MQPGMLAHTGPAGVQWTEYPYQQPPQQPGQPLPQPYNNSLPPQPSQPLSLDPAGGPPFNGYATGQGWNGQQYPQQKQQGGYYPPQQQGGAGQGPGSVVGPSGGGGGGVPLTHQQQQQMAMIGGQQQRMNGYAQQNGMIGYDGGGMGGLPPPPPQQQQYAPSGYPPRSQPPPSSNAPPPYPPQPPYGMNYVHSTNPTSSSPAPPPMVAMSATAQRFQSTPSSSPAPPFQQLGHPPLPPPHQQQQSQLPPAPPHPSSSAAAAAAAAQRTQQQQQGHPPPTAASLQAHLSRVEEVKAMQQNIRQLELILQRGTYQDGAPRAGQPMAPEHGAAMERQLQELKTAELGVINECETFIRAHGGSGNVHHYVERYHAAHAQQAHLQRQQQQAYSQQLAAAAAQQQQQSQAGMYGALPQPPRPASAASFQQQQMGGGGSEMGLPQQVHQRVASYQGQDFSPRPAHHLPPQQQQQQKPPLPQGQQPGMPPSHPQYPPQPGMPRQLPPQSGVHPQVQHQLHRQASSNSLGGVPAPHPPPPGMTLPQQSSLPPHPHSMPPHQIPPHPQQQQQQQQQRPPPPSSAQPQPLSSNAPNPPPGHPLCQPPPPGSLPAHAHNPLQPPSSSATTMSFSPDIPSGLRAQMTAAAREQAQRALVTNRAKMTQQAVRPAVNGEMPVLTTAGFRTKDEWEKMQKEQEAREAARSAAAAAAAAAAKGRAAGNSAATVVGEAGKTHPTVVLAEQAANGGGAVPTLGELVAKVQPQQFWEQLKVVLSKRGVSIAPQGYFVEQRAVNLYELWKLVVGQHGGVLKADHSSAWPAVAAQLNLPSAPSSPIPALLKELYHRTLVPYEEQWSGSIVKQREKEQAMQGAKRMLEARGNGGGGANATAKGNAAPGAGQQQPSSNGHALQQQQFQLGIGPSAQQPQNYVPSSGSPGSFTLPTPAPLANSAPSPSLPFTLPSGTAFSLPTDSPSTHAHTPLSSKNGLPAGASPSQSSMFATSIMPFPPTPMSDPTYASLPLAPTPTSGGGYPPLQHTMASAQLHRTQQPPPPLPPAAEEEPSIEELLAAAAELKAERLAEKAQKAAGQVTSPPGAATVTASTPQTSSTPREQVASPTALAAAAAGQVAPFSLSGAPPSVTLSRANSHSAAAAAVSTSTAASSPGQLAVGTPGSETLSRGASGSRKRDRQMSRETDGGGSGVNGSAAGGGAGGVEGQNADDDEEDEGRKREGSNPFQHSPLSSRAVGAGGGGRISPALAMTPAASSVSSAPPTDGQPTPDLVASKALRPDTGTTTATGGGSPSPHAFSGAFASKAAATNGQQAVSTPASTAPTPSSLHTPSAQLAAGLGGGLTISTPPVPTYASSSSSVSVPISDPFAALNDLNSSPSLGGLGGWDVDAAAVGTTTHSSLNLDFGPSGVGDLPVGGGLNGLVGDGLDFSAFDFGAGGAGDAGQFAIPDGFDFLDTTAAASSSTNNGGGASSAASGAAGGLPHGLQEAGRKPSDDWTGGLLDFEFASDGFN